MFTAAERIVKKAKKDPKKAVADCATTKWMCIAVRGMTHWISSPHDIEPASHGGFYAYCKTELGGFVLKIHLPEDLKDNWSVTRLRAA